MDLSNILASIRKADQEYQLIEDGDKIAVGVSGGKDSMVLLSALHMYSKFKQKNFKVIGIAIKLGFPNMDFTPIQEYFDQLGIEFHVIDSKVYEILKRNPDKDGHIKCSLCSKFKKACVIQAAKEAHCNTIAFAHHGDDAIETFFMNAIYGGKMATFLPKMYLTKTDTTFIRPLIYAYESDIIQAQVNNKIPYLTSTCPNEGITKRQEMKDFLTSFYQSYPMAHSNFIHMLSNEDQMELWHKTNNNPNMQRFKPMNILLDEEDIQLGKRGKRFFLIYTPMEEEDQVRHLQIPQCDGDDLLQHKLTLDEYLRQHHLRKQKRK